MAEYLSVTLKLVCEGCDETVPVNGPVRTATCSRCGHNTEIEASDYLDYLKLIEHFPESVARGLRASLSSFERESLAVLRLQEPRCRACQAQLPVDGVAVGQRGTLTCGCGEAHLSVPPPPWLKGIAPQLVQCYAVSDTEEDGASSAPEQSADADVQGEQPVVMSCTGCGAPLSVGSGARRALDCEHCGNQLEVPTVLWRWLHPLPRAQPWYMRLDSGADRVEEVDNEQPSGVSIWWYLVGVGLLLGALGLYFGLRG